MAVLASVSRPIDREENGGQHADDLQGRRQPHIADQDTVEHGAHDGGGLGLLGDLVGSVGHDVALKRLVAAKHIRHIAPFQAFILNALEVFWLVIFRNADAGQHHADEGDGHAEIAHHIQEFLIEAAAEGSHQLGIDDHVQRHGHHVIQHSLPDAHRRTLFGIIGDQSRKGLGGHVHDRVSNDIQHIAGDKHDNAMAFAGEEREHEEETSALDQPAKKHQRTNLAPAGVDFIVKEGQQRIRDGVEDSGEGQQTANRHRCDSIADGGRVAGQADQEIHRHAIEGVEGDQDDLPEFCLAVLYAVIRDGGRLRLCHDHSLLVILANMSACLFWQNYKEERPSS